MFYREAGQFKTTYAADQQVFPILQDRVGVLTLMAVAVIVVPFVANEYWMTTILIPFLVMSIAALGLNLLTGYAGQLSLGTGGFMATGAFAAYKLATWDIGATLGLDEPMHLHMIFVFLGAGVVTAFVGVLFGIPSLRIKGFYLAVATLAAQFFLLWLFNKVPWFTNYSSSGVISAPPRDLIPGVAITGAAADVTAKYLFLLGMVLLLAFAAKNIIRCHLGRAWMAIRDMDIAAEIIGIRSLQTKLSAFALSSFYCGIAGAAWAFLYTGSVEPLAFSIEVSFKVLFMIIIGGLGSIMGSFLGAGFIVLLPVLLTNGPRLLGLDIPVDMISHLEFMIFGALIIFFLIVEPHGLARLWQIGKEKLRLWPFPY
jgi:branched-chain amino acid transport system permease protein